MVSGCGIYSLFEIPCSVIFYRLFFWVSLISGFMAALGLFYTVSGKLAALSAMLYFGYASNFTKIYHSYHVFVMTLLIVGFSSAHHWLSVDRYLFKYKLTNHYRYHWPLRLVSFYVVYVYFILGAQKLYFGGLDWAFSESLLLITLTSKQQGPLTSWFQQQSYWFVVFSASWSLIVCELLSPLALYKNRLGVAYFFFWLSFHLGVGLVLGGHWSFLSQMAAAAVFLIHLIQIDLVGQGSERLLNFGEA